MVPTYVARVAAVQVPGENEVDAASFGRPERLRGAASEGG